jgi:hypothetical protein
MWRDAAPLNLSCGPRRRLPGGGRIIANAYFLISNEFFSFLGTATLRRVTYCGRPLR